MKQKIVLGIVVLLVLALAGFKYYTYKHPDVLPSEPEKVLTIENIDLIPSSTASSINIQTERPINGKKLGVIEVGASGFNSFVVEVDKQDNWELISKEFGESLAYEGFITTLDVQTGIKKYLAKMFERGVAGRNAHFVMSSGALKNKKTELIAKAIEDMGYVVNRVTADQEAKYALKALLPKSYRSNSFVVDIGSGNTKITSYKNGNPFSVEAPGAKYYQDGKTDDEVATAIKVALKTIPTSQRENCFIIGGVPFKLAKESRNAEERFTLLKAPEEYSFGDDVKLKSGLNIYSAMVQEIPTKYIFDWDANFTIGFLLTLN
jgi:hypothetical protein